MTRPPRPVSVIGTGYLGATHAICLAAIGRDVVAVDSDPTKIEALSAGRLPFYEPDLDRLLVRTLASGRLCFTTDPAEAGRRADVHFICVGTPQLPGSDGADLTYVNAAVETLAPHLRPGALVVGKSTVPVGTAGSLAARLQRLAPTRDVSLAWQPEFLREGFAVEDTLHPDRLVFGVTSDYAEAVLRDVYEPITAAGDVPVIVTDLGTAELVKLAANSFLATKISYINAMAEICEKVDGDVLALASALGQDARIGGRFLRPGLGFGGGCLAKDMHAFRQRAEELGAGESLAFLREVEAINRRCRARTIDAVETLGGSLPGLRVAALGAAFKPDSDDIRDSPALEVAVALDRAGAEVTVFDPAAMPNAARAHPELAYAASALEAIRGADVVVLLTEWKEFAAIDPAVAAAVAADLNVVDARHALDADQWRRAGWRYLALGVPERSGAEAVRDAVAS